MKDVESLLKLAASRDDVIPLGGGLPSPELLPTDELATAFRRAVRAPDIALQYGWSEGLLELREWVAGRLRARGADVGADDVVITAGAQQALALAAAELLDGGRRVHVGDATYAAALALFRLRGARVAQEPGDADALYVMPGVANPTGGDGVPDASAVLALGRPVIVDEGYAELRFDGWVGSPLLAHRRELVWLVGTVSKTVCPGLRVGWLVPPPDRRDAVLARKEASDLQAASLSQALLACFFDGFDYDAHVARIRAAYAHRAAVLADALRRHLPDWRFADPEGGFSLFVDTGAHGSELAFLEQAIDAGVCFDPGSLFRSVDDGRMMMRLSFSYAPLHQLEPGCRRLAAAWQTWQARRQAACTAA